MSTKTESKKTTKKATAPAKTPSTASQLRTILATDLGNGLAIDSKEQVAIYVEKVMSLGISTKAAAKSCVKSNTAKALAAVASA